MGTWLESLLSPAKNWIAGRGLGGYGNLLSSYLKGITAGKKKRIDLLLKEAEMKSLPNLEDIEKIIGYKFNNRSLLDQAFTHPSYRKDGVSYERLEYVGDSVLNLLVAKEQFSMYPKLPPGLLSPLRAANVDTEKLARVAVQHNFHRYIRYRAPFLSKKIQAFIDVLPKHPIHSHGLINAPKVLADVIESTVGAVFIDRNCSIDVTWEVASYLLNPMITPESLQTNAVKKMFELCQKYKLKVRVVDLWLQDGSYRIFVNNQLRGKGVCHEKKEVALNRAANDAYNEVVRRVSLKT